MPRWPVDEALRMRTVRRIECRLPLSDDDGGLAVVNRCRSEQSDPAVVVFAVVPSEEPGTGGPCILDAAESIWKLGPILERFELRFGIGIVVGAVRPGVGLCDS